MQAGGPSPEKLVFALFFLLLSVGLYSEALAQAPESVRPVIKTQGYVPFADAPIHYRSGELHDPVARLQEKLDQGSESLVFDASRGYLPGVLRALEIPQSSQTLVFSKTSFQSPEITPATPRALYFNDDVYAGRVHGRKFLEFISFDPMQGAVFYVLDERKAEHPVFERAVADCLQCHVGASTRGVPGVMLRSLFTRSTGYPAAGTESFITGHESPFQQRWGGWYVTGLKDSDSSGLHMGNMLLTKGTPDSARRKNVEPVLPQGTYLSSTSDVVALLVLAHQTQMHNLITELGYAIRTGAASDKVQQITGDLVRYLLFESEAPLDRLSIEDTAFTKDFGAHALRDRWGRSLRDFDLHRRIFKYPCSYLIYSDDFNALPAVRRQAIYDGLFRKLTGVEASTANVSEADRFATIEILVATKPDLPSAWKQFVTRQESQTANRAETRASVAANQTNNNQQ